VFLQEESEDMGSLSFSVHLGAHVVALVADVAIIYLLWSYFWYFFMLKKQQLTR
jgi:hypothetical protein